MHWNNRVVDMMSENGGEPCFELREVYYNDDNTLMGYADICTVADNIEELQEQVERWRIACTQPVLSLDAFPPINPDLSLDRSNLET